MLAVIKTGGKQYLVSPGQKLQIEKIAKNVGETIEFNEVLLVNDKEATEIGTPSVSGAKVVAKITKQGKDDKVMVVKYKSKSRYSVTHGHRQHFTEVEIMSIEK